MDILFIAIAFLAGLAIGYLLFQALRKSTRPDMQHALLAAQYQEKIAELGQLKEQLRAETEKIIGLNNELTKTETELYHLKLRTEEQKTELETLRETFLRQFSSVSNQLLVENAAHFRNASSDSMQKILEPLKERIKEFEAKVDATYEKSLKENVSLREQIAQLVGLNQQMSQDALSLTRALRGERKTQGNWGEYLLETLLERSGLESGLHYRREETRRDEEQKVFRPDVIVYLPDDKHLVIDSKVSLVAYDAWCNCEEDALRQAHLRSHLLSLRTHYTDLGKKDYPRLHGINSPDFVLMYIPIEPAFNLAMQADRELFIEALDRNVVFVTTSTLLATLRTVAGVWRQENQKRNVLRIAEESGKLYDKFVGFVEDLRDIGVSIERSQSRYRAAMNKLSEGNGNLVKKVELLKKLGARTSKHIDSTLLKEVQGPEPPDTM